MSRQVVVEHLEREISIINRKGEEVTIGSILSEDYQGEVKRFSFSPDTKNPWANETKKKDAYILGTGSRHASFINPADAQRVLLDQGWAIKEQFASMGGLSLQTVFIRQENPFSDPIDFDRSLWGIRKDMTKMWPCVILNTNLTLGRIAAEYTAAIYRQICTNGMTASIMQFPSVRFRHSEWDDADIEERISVEMPQEYNSLPLGPVVCKSSHLRATVALLQAYSSNDPAESSKFQFISDNFGTLSPNVVKPWAMANYIEHLKALCIAKMQTGDIHAMDLINAYTSGVNQKRLETHNDRGVLAALDATEGVVSTTASLATLASLFSEN